jgi:hypothetical protein
VADSSGDRLDAVLCLMQAGLGGSASRALASRQQVDAVEGWITSA